MINIDHFLADQIEPTSRTEDAELLSSEPSLIRGAQNAPELCQLVSDFDAALWPDEAFIDPKLDGFRSIAIRPNQIVSREGQPLAVASHCVEALRAIEAVYNMPMVFDGELTHVGGFQGMQKAAARGRPTKDVTFWLFDAIPLAEWEKGQKYSGPQQELAGRRRALKSAISRAAHPNVGAVSGWVMSKGEAIELAEGMWQRGLEGIVVKDARAFYERGRTTSWMRMKRNETMDVKAINYQWMSKGNYGLCECKTSQGARFTLLIKPEKAARQIEDIIFKSKSPILEITHSGLTDAGVPRHATFVRLRTDKTEA